LKNLTLGNKGRFAAKIHNSGVFLQPQRPSSPRAVPPWPFGFVPIRIWAVMR
jgi:hypothetical protein